MRAWWLGDNDRVTQPLQATAPTTASSALFERARAVTPGGVNSPVRAFNAVGGTPRFIRSASGAWLTDVDGNEYVDLICSWGPMLLGHAHPEVQAAVAAAVARGTSYGTPTEPEVELAEEIVSRTPVEAVRFVSSGTEATMSAIRLARGFTGRDLVVKFAGCYHGHVDALLAVGGLRPGHPRRPGHARRPGLRDRRDHRAALQRPGRGRARPSPSTATGSPASSPRPPPATWASSRPSRASTASWPRPAARHGALFVSDEVMTGFRATRQGGWGLDGAVEGWTPDLMTFGKVMGGGFPAAAFGGRADVMGRLAPDGPVYQAGTLSGNPVATTAGLATLRLATDEVYAQLGKTAATIGSAAVDALVGAGVPHVCSRAGTMFSIFFADGDGPRLRRRRPAGHRLRSRRSSMPCSRRGVYLPPSAYEAWFVSAAHDDRAVQTVLDALPAAARAAAAAAASEGRNRS